MSELSAKEKFNLERWSMRQVDSDSDEPLYDGIETDENGDWVRWEEVQETEQAVEAKWKEAIGATDLQGSSPDNFIQWLRKDVTEQAKALERERIEQVIRNCCVAITAETLVRAIRRGGRA
ncbi:hypothetical protein LCGC14_0812140 [marine sediment metagenome]|uniref:Uncharacterized protein n=1 Tax=marine sediment metagenome TaxID=412755 RepID=A0A0F9S698_9ZZZZ